jgi:beta-1,4-glucosyltransferase
MYAAEPDAHSARPDGVRLGPLEIPAWSRDDALCDVIQHFGASQRVAFVNTHLLYHALKDDALALELKRFTLFNDGVGVDFLARTLCGRGFSDNLNGTDFVPMLLQEAPPGTRLFLFGGAEIVVQAAARALQDAYPHIELCGSCDGYESGDATVRSALQKAEPDLVLVALGNPLQELWIARNWDAAPRASFLGVGALFDFLAETHPRAPKAVREARLEWLFRLSREPKRLWRRYTYEVGYVALALLSERLRPS